MGAVRTLEELARIGGQRGPVSDRSVRLRQDEVDGDLLLDAVSGDRVTLDRMTIDGTLTVRSCHIDELVIDHVEADALLVSNSRIGRLIVRNASLGCDVTVIDTSLDSLALHSCGTTRLERLRVEELVQLNALRGPVRISNTRVSSLTVRSQIAGGRLGRPRVQAVGLRAREDVTFADLWLSALELGDVETKELNLQRVRLDRPFRAAELRCSETVRVNGLVTPAEGSAITDSTVHGSVEFRDLTVCENGRALPGATARLALRNSTVLRLTAASENRSVISLHDSSVTGTLALPVGGSRYSLDSGSSIGDMELAGAVFRDGHQVVSFLERSFTEVTAVTLESVRSALAKRNRNREVDQLYYLTRQHEAALLPPLRRGLTRGLLGGVLGWGVRARNPACILLAGVLLTAVGLHLAGPLRAPGQGVTDMGGAGRSVVLAFALWLNVGTGLPAELTSALWSALAVGFTAAGMLFTTLVVGIVIRKLVR